MTRRAREHKELVKTERAFKLFKKYGARNMILLHPYGKPLNVKTFALSMAKMTKILKVNDVSTHTIVENTEDTFKITFNSKLELDVKEIIVHPVKIEQREH